MINRILPPAGEVMFSPVSVCLPLTVYSKITEQIFMKFYGVVGNNPGTNRLDFQWLWPKINVTRGQRSKSFV